MKILIAVIIFVMLSGCHTYSDRYGYWQAMDTIETQQTLKKIEANTFWNSIANDPGLQF